MKHVKQNNDMFNLLALPAVKLRWPAGAPEW